MQPIVSWSSLHSWQSWCAKCAGFPTNSKASASITDAVSEHVFVWLLLSSTSETTQRWLQLCCVEHVCLCYQAAHPCLTRRDDVLDHMSFCIHFSRKGHICLQPATLQHACVVHQYPLQSQLLLLLGLPWRERSSHQCQLLCGVHSPLGLLLHFFLCPV